MLKQRPFFSIVIPVYQAEQYLKECIDSILQQDFHDYEIWLIDDGCKDNSPTICDTYQQKEEKIHVYHKQNEGVSAARNDGIQRAQGQYILFLDSDDALTNHALQQLYERIFPYPNVDIITGTMDSNIVVKHDLQTNQAMDVKDFYLHELKAKTMSHAACLYIYRNDFLKANQLSFPIGYHHEDEYFTSLALLKAKQILPTNVCYYHYRENETSITMNHKNFDKNYYDLCEILKQLELIYLQHTSGSLQAYLMESLLEKYLFAYVKVKGYRSELKDVQMNDFIKGKAITKKNKMKVLLYQINKKLYCKIASR